MDERSLQGYTQPMEWHRVGHDSSDTARTHPFLQSSPQPTWDDPNYSLKPPPPTSIPTPIAFWNKASCSTSSSLAPSLCQRQMCWLLFAVKTTVL